MNNCLIEGKKTYNKTAVDHSIMCDIELTSVTCVCSRASLHTALDVLTGLQCVNKEEPVCN